MWAVIGGSGFEKFDAFQAIETLDTKTPFGETSSGFKRVKLNKHELLFLSRHGQHHELLPSEINYPANIYALKKYGAKGVLSFSAVGSLEKDIQPGDLVLPNQYIDRTKSLRKHTFSGQGVVAHVSLAQPVCPALYRESQKLLIKNHKDFSHHFQKTYVCIEGPYFSSRSESLFYRSSLKAHIIGMTNFPEYALAREAGLPYLSLCFVTDYDCWDENRPHVTVQEVMGVMKNNHQKAFQVLQTFLNTGALWKESPCPEQGLKTSVFTPEEAIPKEVRKWLDVLRG